MSAASAPAEACLRRAIDIAQHQHAKLWELRASIALARLLDQGGRRQEAHRLLSPVHDWFTEGLDAADLVEARVLLQQLSR